MYAFLVLPLFVVTYLFFSIRRVALGKKGSIIALALLLCIFLCFFMRTSFVFAAGQTALVIWVMQALMLYLLSDIFRGIYYVVSKRLGKLPSIEYRKKTRTLISRIVLAASFVVTACFLAYGIPHNANYILREAEIKLPQNSRPFTAYYFSDLHIDPIFSKSKLERMIHEVDSLKPDLILFGGDLADITDKDLTEKGYDKLFRELTSRAKSYGVVGNHEAYMEGMGSDPEKWMTENGMAVLSDSTICNHEIGVCLSGRVDFQVSRRRDIPRRPLAEFSQDAYCQKFSTVDNANSANAKSNAPDSANSADSVINADSTANIKNVNCVESSNSALATCSTFPWILLDHQPKGIEPEYNGKKPTLSLSGHTHDGQFFPVTAIIGLVWKLAYGFGQIDGYDWLVTSGVDSWGPPVRVGSDAEIWVLKFKQ